MLGWNGRLIVEGLERHESEPLYGDYGFDPVRATFEGRPQHLYRFSTQRTAVCFSRYLVSPLGFHPKFCVVLI